MSTQRRQDTGQGGKLTGWPRPSVPFGASIGLNPVRMAVLVVLALGGLGIGYVVGKYVAPAQTPSKPPVETSSPPSAAHAPQVPRNAADGMPPHSDYEEKLPRDIVIERNGELSRIELPEPHVGIDFGAHPPQAPTVSEPPAAEPTAPTQPEPQVETAPAAPTERTPAEAPRPVLMAALPDDIAERQRLEGDKLPAWERFAVPIHRDSRPKVVIVIDDLGLDRRRSRLIAELPGPLTMSFMAYAHDLKEQTSSARRAGHELMLHVPMEPGSAKIDPGPNVLLSGMPKAELDANIAWNLDQVSGYVGINNHMGSRFTADRDGMREVVAALKKRGLLFLDSLTSGRSVAHDVARDAGIPFAIRNVFIDHEDDLDAINHQLQRTLEVARKTGVAIAIGHPRDNTIKALKEWLPKLDGEGVQLVPVSAVARIASRG